MSPQAQRTRRREQREETRRQILAAAERLLRERPFRELTVDVVMAETNLTRTAFYRHFDDATDLVLRLYEDIARELFVVVNHWAETAGVGYPTPGREGLTGMIDFYVRNGPLIRAIAEAAVTDERIELAYRGSIDRFIEVTTGALERMAGEGLLQVPDPRALARAMTIMNTAYLLAEFGSEPQGDPKVALETLEQIWLRLAIPLPSLG
jgi:TetR/AcrR family transcriptional regulator, ethionamide resistance regulator